MLKGFSAQQRRMARVAAVTMAAAALSALVAGNAGAQTSSSRTRAADQNHAASSTAVQPAAIEATPAAGGPIVGTASLPAPSSSFDIRLTVKNSSGSSTIGARDVQAVILDCFSALHGDSLTIDDVFLVTPPPGGTATVNVGTGSTVGPAVLTFTGFNNTESTAFNLDPDTWDDSSFGATRLQMGGCRVEVVFFRVGTETPLRAMGTLVHRANDTMVANLKQVNP